MPFFTPCVLDIFIRDSYSNTMNSVLFKIKAYTRMIPARSPVIERGE